MKKYSESRLARQVSSRWKNDGGETTQLAIYPPGSSLEGGDFYWRVSKAKIDKTGPFSEFRGYSRGLIQLTGDPFRLGDKKLNRLEPFLFSGDNPIRCELPVENSGKETTDIGVLVNRAWGDFKMSSYHLEAGKKLARYGDFVVYYAHQGEMEAEGERFSTGELVVLKEETMVQAVSDLVVVVIEITESGRC